MLTSQKILLQLPRKDPLTEVWINLIRGKLIKCEGIFVFPRVHNIDNLATLDYDAYFTKIGYAFDMCLESWQCPN